MTTPKPSRIEIISVRDPDGGTYIQTFVDGAELSAGVEIFEIDAGRGYEYSDWIEDLDSSLRAASSDAVRAALREAYMDPPGKDYIDHWPEDQRDDPIVEETTCDLCGHPLARRLGSEVWFDPDELADNTPELCLMNEPEDDVFGPHQPDMDGRRSADLEGETQ